MKRLTVLLSIVLPFACSASPIAASDFQADYEVENAADPYPSYPSPLTPEEEAALAEVESTIPKCMADALSERAQTRDRIVAYPLVYHPIQEIFVRDQQGIEVTCYDDLGNATDYVTLAAGAHVRFADNSVWQVAPSDQWKVAQWRAEDLVRVKPNTGYSRDRQFYNIISNLNSGDEVQAKARIFGNLNLPNRTMDKIRNISSVDQLITMSHGGKWEIYADDAKIVAETWAQGDIIIVGTNEGWFSSYCPNVLMNLKRKNSCRAIWKP